LSSEKRKKERERKREREREGGRKGEKGIGYVTSILTVALLATVRAIRTFIRTKYRK